MDDLKLVTSIRELTAAIERLRHVIGITGPFGERTTPVDAACTVGNCKHVSWKVAGSTPAQ